MDSIRRIAAINDLSGGCRCSLTAALPIISALGIQCCVLPTAILSNHTGFESFFFDDYTDKMNEFSCQWQKMNLKFDCIYSGFLGSHKQIEEVLDFIERDLGAEGMKRSVVVVATGDQSSICRMRAAYTTTAIAEYFRDQGKDVMLMMDSVTRFCHAQREIGTATGEPPTQSGYPASVWDMLPKLLERSGTNDKGSITAFYTVLVDGDDHNEPVADAVRSILDGHIVLDRAI